MPHRRADHNPNGPERREKYRRDEDDETREIVDHAVHDAPIVHRLLKTGKVLAVVVPLCTFVGTAAGALVTYGQNKAANAAIRSEMIARIDTNSARIRIGATQRDSILSALGRIETGQRQDRLIQCQLLRRFAPDLRPDGCDK